MGRGAVPEHLRDIDEAWKGTDNSSWLMRLKKRIQYRFALGPRDGSARELPITLFAIRGKKAFRFENTDGTDFAPTQIKKILTYKVSLRQYYLSRIQPWCRWHIALQWPLFFQCHVFWNKKDIVKYPKYKSDFGIKKLFSFHIGWKRDADIWYQPTLFIGGNFE